MSAGNGTGADDDNRMQVDSHEKSKEEGNGERPNQKGICTSINTCKNCGRPGQWVKYCWRSGGGADDNNTSNNSCTKKGNNKRGKGKGKQVDVGGNQSAFRHSLNRVVSLTHTEHDRSSRVQFRNERLDHGSDNQFPVFRTETSWCRVFAFLTVMHSLTRVRSSIQDKNYRCWILESTRRLELASNMTEDVRLHANFHACDIQSEFGRDKCSDIVILYSYAPRDEWKNFRQEIVIINVESEGSSRWSIQDEERCSEPKKDGLDGWNRTKRTAKVLRVWSGGC